MLFIEVTIQFLLIKYLAFHTFSDYYALNTNEALKTTRLLVLLIKLTTRGGNNVNIYSFCVIFQIQKSCQNHRFISNFYRFGSLKKKKCNNVAFET